MEAVSTPIPVGFFYFNIRTGEKIPVTTEASSLSANWTIEYVPRNPTEAVEFYVNGNLYHRERVEPYIISGDINGRPFPLKDVFPDGTKISVVCLDSSSDETDEFIIGPLELTPTPPTQPQPDDEEPVYEIQIEDGQEITIDLETRQIIITN